MFLLLFHRKNLHYMYKMWMILIKNKIQGLEKIHILSYRSFLLMQMTSSVSWIYSCFIAGRRWTVIKSSFFQSLLCCFLIYKHPKDATNKSRYQLMLTRASVYSTPSTFIRSLSGWLIDWMKEYMNEWRMFLRNMLPVRSHFVWLSFRPIYPEPRRHSFKQFTSFKART